MNEIWTLDDAARYFKCSTRTVRKMAEKQGLPYFMIGRLWRFRSEDVLAWQSRQMHNEPKKEEVA